MTDKVNEAVTGAIGETSEWSAEDKDWLTKLPEGLRPAAQRHGKKLFQLTMKAGAANHALSILGSQGAGNRAIMQACGVLGKCMNDLAHAALREIGKSMADFVECKTDIERIASLADAGQYENLPQGSRVSKGGIILDS